MIGPDLARRYQAPADSFACSCRALPCRACRPEGRPLVILDQVDPRDAAIISRANARVHPRLSLTWPNFWFPAGRRIAANGSSARQYQLRGVRTRGLRDSSLSRDVKGRSRPPANGASYLMIDRTNLRYLLRLLEHGPFERRPRGGLIGDAAVERLLASGRVEIVGSTVQLALRPSSGPSRSRNERPSAGLPS